jgi:O-antigen ligase
LTVARQRDVLGVRSSGSATVRVLHACERSAAELLLVAALAVSTILQGGYFARGQIAAGALIAAATIVALPIDRRATAELGLPAAAAGGLAVWGLIRAAPSGALGTAGRQALLLAAVALVLLVCRQADETGAAVMLWGVLGIGAVVTAAGWLAVVERSAPWAIKSAGLWRAASTLTYSNAMAALMVPLALVGLALLAERPRSIGLSLLISVLLLGSAITLSRAGALAMALGLVILLLLRGRAILRAVAAPLVGVIVAFAGLLPSIPTWPPPRPLLALAGLAGGLCLTAVLVRFAGRRTALVVAVSLVAAACVGVAAFPKPVRHLWHHRASVSSPSRSNAASQAFRMVERHPVAGTGFGSLTFQRREANGTVRFQQYAHDEYLQTLVQEGAIGLGLLLALLAAFGRLLWRARPAGRSDALWAGVVAAACAAAVHAGFDFVWHVPVVPLMVAALIGLATAPAARIGRAADRRESG